MIKKHKWTPVLLLFPFIFILTLAAASCFSVLAQSLGYIPAFGLTEITLSYYIDVMTNPDFLRSLGVSLQIAGCSAVLSAILGTLVCAALVRRNGNAALYLIRVPILVPHAVAAVFMITLFSQTGLLARIACVFGWISDPCQFPQLLYTSGYGGAILAYLWKEIPFVAYFVLALMSGVSKTLGEAAENLGASPLRSFFLITLPLSLPAVCKAFLIIFIFAFGSYELPMLLGVTYPKALPVQAYLAYTAPDLRSRPAAMAIYGMILAVSVLLSALFSAAVRRLSHGAGGEA